MSDFQDAFWADQGYDELKKVLKLGNEYCKDVAGILQERSEIEMVYVKNLQRLLPRTQKLSKEGLGSLCEAWNTVHLQLDAEIELHRTIAQGLVEEAAKPLKSLIENQARARKLAEQNIEKTSKLLVERKAEQNKAKRTALIKAKEHEVMLQQQEELQRSDKVTEEKITKFQEKCHRNQDLVVRADRSYLDLVVKTECSRHEWESAMSKGCRMFQNLELERIMELQDTLNKYNSHMSVLGPKYTMMSEAISRSVEDIDAEADIQQLITERGTGPNQPVQILYESMEEDLTVAWDDERRRYNLNDKISHICSEIEKERRTRVGVRSLQGVYTDTPDFADQEARDDVDLQVNHSNAMIDLLQCCEYKLVTALAKLNRQSEPTCSISCYIEQTKDRQGGTGSVLKVPLSVWLSDRPERDRDLYSGQISRCGTDPVNTFPSNATDTQHSSPVTDNCTPSTGDDGPRKPHSDSRVSRDSFDQESFDEDIGMPQVEVLYDYEGQQDDDISIRTGDLINLREKVDDNWWYGELNGQCGMFPAAYVREL